MDFSFRVDKGIRIPAEANILDYLTSLTLLLIPYSILVLVLLISLHLPLNSSKHLLVHTYPLLIYFIPPILPLNDKLRELN